VKRLEKRSKILADSFQKFAHEFVLAGCYLAVGRTLGILVVLWIEKQSDFEEIETPVYNS